MTDIKPSGRLLASLAGLCFTAGGLTILLGPALTRPLEWTSYHVLTILTVFGTISAGHLMIDARRQRHWMSAFGFLMLFFAGTGLVVYNSVGRQAETTDTVALTAEAQNRAITDKQNDLDDAKDRLANANDNVAREMRGERCGPKCKDWKTRGAEIKARVAELEGELKALGPQKPINPKAAKMASVAELLFGADRDTAEAAFSLLEPFLWTLFFEIGSIVSCGFAFRHRRCTVQQARVEAPTIQTDYHVVPDQEANIIRGYFGPDNPPKGGLSKSEALDDLMERLALGETIPSQDTLAKAWNRPKQTVSDWLSQWRKIGVIPQPVQSGRCKAMMSA